MPQVYYKYGASWESNPTFRPSMEDTHVHEANVDGVPGQGFFAVFDGHGGKNAADHCEESVFKTFMRIRTESPNLSLPEVFDQTFVTLDQQLEETDNTSSGSAAVVSYLHVLDCVGGEKKSRITTANCGDARAVLSRGGQAIRLTYDHKASDPKEQQRVSKAGGMIFNNRVLGMLAITRAIGDPALKPPVVCHPFTTETDILDEDEFLILACDGVWDVFSDQEAVDLVRGVTSPREAASLLLKASLHRGSTDNVTIVVVRFQKEPVDNPEEDEEEEEEERGDQSTREDHK